MCCPHFRHLGHALVSCGPFIAEAPGAGAKPCGLGRAISVPGPSGLPQSAQKRARASFTWPQTLHFRAGGENGAAVSELGVVTRAPRQAPPGRGRERTAWAANIGLVKRGVNERNRVKSVSRF